METLLYVLKQLTYFAIQIFFIMSENNYLAFQNFVKLEVIGKINHLQYCRSNISLGNPFDIQ